MSDEELIARLGEDVFYGDERLHNLSRHNPLHMEARDRIKALTKERDAIDTKLAQAVKLIDLAVELARWDRAPKLRDDMIDFTTEIKGESHD